MNALTNRSATTNSLISLPNDLAALVERANRERANFSELPIITPEQRRAIPAALADVEKTLVGATPDQVLGVLATLNVVLPKRQNEASAEAAAKIYAVALADIPADILEAAALEAIKVLSFFPKVAELRELAWPELARRKAIKVRLESFAVKFDHEYRPPLNDPVRPEDLAKLRKRLSSRFQSRRKVTA